MHLAHVINLLVKNAEAEKNPHVNLVKTYQENNTATYATPNRMNYVNKIINTANYAPQASTVPDQQMYQHGYYAWQIGAADNQYMYSTAGMQISAGNNSTVIGDSAGSRVEVRGKNNLVRLPQGGSFLGPEGTRYEVFSEKTSCIGVIGENGIAPNKWATVRKIAQPRTFEIKLTQ